MISGIKQSHCVTLGLLLLTGCATSCYITLHYVTLCYIMLHCVTLCCIMLHCVTLCCIILCIYTQCHVFIQENGERSILMAPAATSQIDTAAVQTHFGNGFTYASLVPRPSHHPLFDHIRWKVSVPMYLPPS